METGDLYIGGKKITLEPISFEVSVDEPMEITGIVRGIEENAGGDETMKVKKIIFNDPATIVYWQDGTKTVVKTMEGTAFNPYYGFLCAVGKKLYGSNSAINRIIKEWVK